MAVGRVDGSGDGVTVGDGVIVGAGGRVGVAVAVGAWVGVGEGVGVRVAVGGGALGCGVGVIILTPRILALAGNAPARATILDSKTKTITAKTRHKAARAPVCKLVFLSLENIDVECTPLDDTGIVGNYACL
jgi:hypothetical protein